MNAHAAARDAWLARARDVLDAQRHVAGFELVGSLGRGDGDDWSDVDLLVFVEGDARVAVDPVLGDLGDLALHLSAPHNTRANGHSFGAVFLVDGLPIATDWYVWPAVLRGGSFDELNAVGPRGAMPPLTDVRQRSFELMMTIVEAKRVARGASTTAIDELRRRARTHSSTDRELVDAIDRHLDLIEVS